MHRRDFLRTSASAAAATIMFPRAIAAPAGAKSNENREARFDASTIGKIEQLMPTLMREKAVPGVSLAVVQNGRLMWQRAFGVKDTSSNEPVDQNTVFEAASVSKTVFAYVVLKLCERGTLGLDTPLSKYSQTRFIKNDPRLDRVTARHALSHTTGFPEWRSAAALKFETDPGERFHYSGEGYFYLQSVITELTGRSFPSPCGRYEGDFEVCATDFDAFMRRALLDPLGMAASGYLRREGFAQRVARPHDTKGQPLAQKKPNAADIARYGAVGELRTTATDYAKFLVAVLNRPAGEAFLGPAMHEEMIRPQVKLGEEKIDGADSWALGWAVQERPTGNVILHSGGQSGFRSLTMASPERRSAFVIFTNSDNGGFICYDPVLATILTPLIAG